MQKIGFFEGRRLHISDYQSALHDGKVYCEDGHLLIPKRGEVRMHHFSHRPGEGANCSASDGKTEWHLWWQNRLLPQAIELRLTKPVVWILGDGRREIRELTKIADSSNVISSPQGEILSIVEFQNSVMSADEIKLRETFYSRRDLMSAWGVPDCKSELTWIFNLNGCDIDIVETYGDLVCIDWAKGTQYMMAATARTFYDLGRRDLIQILASHKTNTNHPKFIGRLVSLAAFDEFFFKGVLDCKNDADRRLNTHPLQRYDPLPVSIGNTARLEPLIEKLKKVFFKSSSKADRRTLETEIESLLVALRQNV